MFNRKYVQNTILLMGAFVLITASISRHAYAIEPSAGAVASSAVPDEETRIQRTLDDAKKDSTSST